MNPGDDIEELQGDPALSAFFDDVRTYAYGPPPALRPDLAKVLEQGMGSATVREQPVVARPGPLQGALGGLLGRVQGRRGRLGLGASVLALTVLGTGSAGALPGPAQKVFERTADVVGIDLPEEARPIDPPPAQGPEPDERTPVEPAGPEEPEGTPHAPPPPGDRRTGTPTGPGDGATPGRRGAGAGRPEVPEGAGVPGGGLSREGGRGRPVTPPAPASPPRAEPPEASPGGPPSSAPAENGNQGNGEELGGAGARQGMRPVTPLPSPARRPGL